MIVVDASVILELLLRTPASAAVEARLFDSGESLHAPHLLDLEVIQVLRGYGARGELSPLRGQIAIGQLARFPLTRHPHEPLLSRIWALRANLTAYDAAYVVLAEGLGATVLTRDQRLANSAPRGVVVEVIQ